MNDLKKILSQKLLDDDVGHFYILSPGSQTSDKDYIRNWALELIADTLSDSKKTFTNENIVNHEDLLIISKDEKDQSSYKLADFNTFFSFLNYDATRFKRKLIIIDNAEKLSIGVSNKLLKTLEEPPIKCTILLINSMKVSLLETIKSRAIKLTIPTPKQKSNLDEINTIIEQIKEGKTLDEFTAMYKGNKEKEINLFRSLSDWMNKKSCDTSLFYRLDLINKQIVEDHRFNAPPLNRLHKTYFLIKEIIDG